MNGARRIERLLIANRGEIAVRIARAARDAGIVPLGVYSEADRKALHVAVMDDAFCIGPAPARESYLDPERILEAARQLRADAVHPGYGFLSERAAFARAVIAAGFIFVGPPPDAIAAMGDKTEAKHRAREHGIPVIPGYEGADQSVATLRREALGVGLPLIIKASAGGGGRGMRVVDDFERFEEALESAQREALGAFGDSNVLLEKYLPRARHIEFQVLADAAGNTIHVGERECSIQRRHQKIVEEAPSVALDPALRERMGAAAVRAARSVGYANAGTVEFLLDEDGSFYFLEMNARLQVEHPVTELVYGLDLVREQLAVAGGASLTIAQADVVARGWAIEVRVNAEDPASGYLPAIGTILRWEPPAGTGIRLDSGVRSTSEVSIYYDSMLAKLIAYGADRPQAIERLTQALEVFAIEGVPTNLPLLLGIAQNPAFRAGDTTTAFLTEHPALLQPGAGAEPDGLFLLAIGAVLGDPRSWRVGSVGVPVRLASAARRVAVYGSRTDGATGQWRLEGDIAGDFEFEIAGERVVVLLAGERLVGRVRVDERGVEVVAAGRTYRFAFGAAPALAAAAAASASLGRGTIVAPMPGKILKVTVSAGDTVIERDLLVVLEAMKMEHRIEASRDGVVKRVSVVPGAIVAGGATLVELEGTVNAT